MVNNMNMDNLEFTLLSEELTYESKKIEVFAIGVTSQTLYLPT